jgi:hypothetical protein
MAAPPEEPAWTHVTIFGLPALAIKSAGYAIEGRPLMAIGREGGRAILWFLPLRSSIV